MLFEFPRLTRPYGRSFKAALATATGPKVALSRDAAWLISKLHALFLQANLEEIRAFAVAIVASLGRLNTH